MEKNIIEPIETSNLIELQFATIVGRVFTYTIKESGV
jgi:hypothetical protein